MSKDKRRTLELLAPARDVDTAKAAIGAGADAVYIGGPSHGARAAAGNSVADIAELCAYAHTYRARVYVTLNTLVYEEEIADVERLVGELYAAGVDALIVQDMSLLRMKLPPIALHASTQCDTRTPAKAAFLEQVGFSQIVLPREFTLDEIRAVAECTQAPLEAFVHGALCVCYSGDCRASLVSGGRSANRGECAQICRLPYDLVDKDGKVLVEDRHLLSLRDLNRIDAIEEMADAGVSSFKIEGRLKSKSYVINVVRAYSQILDDLCRRRPEDYRRQSVGYVECNFDADVSRAFNRGFTSYFLRASRPTNEQMSSLMTPKFVGVPIGKLGRIQGNILTIDLLHTGALELRNGDGIAWFDARGKFNGARVNRVDGRRIYLQHSVDIPERTTLYRNYDKAFEEVLDASYVRRIIPLDIALRSVEGLIVADIEDRQRGLRVSASMSYDVELARSPQESTQRDIFSRLGDTSYRLMSFESTLGNCFISRSALTSLRRTAIRALDHAAASTVKTDIRRQEKKDAQLPTASLTFHDNVANSLSRKFYIEHGAKRIEPAMELDLPTSASEVQVMTTRYCLRRELGACLRSDGANKLPAELYLRPAVSLSNQATMVRTLRIECDCHLCQMRIVALPRNK